MVASRSSRGFTLLELLIAIVIFAIVGVLAMGGYNQLVHQREIAAATMERVRNLQRCVMRISQDFEQMAARPIRDATSASDMPALLTSSNSGDLLEFTRAGWTNPTGINRSTLQRVRYRLVDNKLYRDYWGVLDRTLNATPIEVQMLDKVTSVSFRFMDNGRQWQTTWPASLGAQGGIPAASFASRDLPIAIEVTINLQDWGEIKRLVEVPNL